MRWRYPVAARLTTILAALAVLTLVMAWIVQDRAVSRGLSRAAETRLDGAARATGRLLSGHVREVVARYAAVSRTPELRAHLELSHEPTLARMAGSLARQTGAAHLILLDEQWKVRTRFGAEQTSVRLLAAWRALRREGSGAPGCVGLGGSDLPANIAATGIALAPCVFAPNAPPQATLQRLAGELQISVLIPLMTGKRRVGALLISEPLGDASLDAWTELVGARIAAAGPATASEDPLVRTVIALPNLELRVSSSLAPELATLAATRQNQAFAGVVALLVAFALSALLARDFLRPIREIQRATEQVGRGNLDVRLDSERTDEIGDVARVLDQTLDRLRSSQKHLRNVQRIAKFGDWSVDLENGVVEGSPEFANVLGLAANSDTTLGAFVRRFAPSDRTKLDHAITRCAHEGVPIELDLHRIGQQRGDHIILHLRGRSVVGSDGKTRVEGSVQDITDRRRAEEQIRFLAFHDSLTGLPNRRFLSERLALAITPGPTDGFSVLFFDLDRFKLVNDSLGHSAGDELLRMIGQRLTLALPDAKGAAVARFGGDEFTLLLPGIVDTLEVSEYARMLLHMVAKPVHLEGNEMVITGSVGIARWPEDGATIETILRGCDTALHQAKENGRNGFCLYESSMEAAANQRWTLENRLRRAIDSMQFELYYQPRIAAQERSLAGFEALLRWNDSEFGGYKPDEFLPVAEETGLIIPLGSWVLRSVTHQIRSWLDEGLPVPFVSVNLSGRQLTPELVDIVRDALARSGVAASHLELEVTESAVIADAEVGIAVLQELRDLGLRISLDDFGTGYSSLSYLRNLPISGLKIDRSFVRSISNDDQDAEFVASIISMAKVLGLSIIAEGVETEEQADLLVEMGCDELQGFFFGEPRPPEHARLRLEEKPLPKRARRRSRRTPG